MQSENSKKAKRQHENATKMFDFTAIAHRLWTVTLTNDSYQACVINTGSTFLVFTTAVQSKLHKYR